jgi:triphosphoribosyl-dephospho-CoA synthase
MNSFFKSICGESIAQPRTTHNVVERIGAYACEALTREVMLTPKPGLVDRRNTGAHRDMDVSTFEASIAAIGGFFPQFVASGIELAANPVHHVLPAVRPIGVRAEEAMFRATGGVNTHKGGIFSMGLLCTASGRLTGQGLPLTPDSLCDEVARISHGLVDAELRRGHGASTAGERLFQRHGLTGARGEAASGFTTVRHRALPVYLELKNQPSDDDTALLHVLLHLMADNVDTNVVSRGGMEGLDFVRRSAQSLLADGGARHPEGHKRLMALDDAMIARNLSPGGSADLLAVTLFLAKFDPA